MNQSEIRDAIECLQESAFTKGELELYERYWDIIRVERARIEDAGISELTGLDAESVAKLRTIFNKYGNDTELHFDEV
ncbi:MAG: hypothetical protein WCP32_12765 [Bacteroidota bacterium]